MIPFHVDFRPGAAIYEQVVYAAKKAMMAGQLRPGDAFPSVRTLSRELKINPNTAHKVITHLVQSGLLEIRPEQAPWWRIVHKPAERKRPSYLKNRLSNWWLKANAWALTSKICRTL